MPAFLTLLLLLQPLVSLILPLPLLQVLPRIMPLWLPSAVQLLLLSLLFPHTSWCHSVSLPLPRGPPLSGPLTWASTARHASMGCRHTPSLSLTTSVQPSPFVVIDRCAVDLPVAPSTALLPPLPGLPLPLVMDRWGVDLPLRPAIGLLTPVLSTGKSSLLTFLLGPRSGSSQLLLITQSSSVSWQSSSPLFPDSPSPLLP